MGNDVRIQKALNTALLVGCIYEVVALATQRTPTITKVIRKMNKNNYSKLFVYIWCGYISWHFLEPLE